MTATLIVSDLHSNSTVALCPHTVTHDDGGSYHPSSDQHWLQDSWCQMVETVKSRAWGDIYTVVNGDLAEADAKNRSLQLISRNPATIKRIAGANIEPLDKISKGVFIIRGTGAHGGQSGHFEEEVAEKVEHIVKCPETGAYSWWTLLWEIDDVKMDIAHHAPVGAGRPENRKKLADRIAVDVMMSYNMRREPIPHLAIRSHVHYFCRSYDRYPTEAVVTPSWTFATEHTQKIAPNERPDIGAVMINTDQGKYTVEYLHYTPPRRFFFTVADILAQRQKAELEVN